MDKKTPVEKEIADSTFIGSLKKPSGKVESSSSFFSGKENQQSEDGPLGKILFMSPIPKDEKDTPHAKSKSLTFETFANLSSSGLAPLKANVFSFSNSNGGDKSKSTSSKAEEAKVAQKVFKSE